MIEKALRYELNKIQEIEDKIYPTNAPEGEKSPYLVYITSKKPLKDLNGIKENRDCYVMLNVLCSSYAEMKNILKKVENMVISLALRNIGKDNLYIKDISITDISETYEEKLKLQRGIIGFTVYYKEG